MRGFAYLLSIFAVVALGFWAYGEGYDTRALERDVSRLKREIGRTHQELSVLRAEWAYLNRPDRLHALAEMNFERLGLVALAADHFADAAMVPDPPPPVPDWPEAEPLAGIALGDEVDGVIIMTYRFGAEADPAMIAPPMPSRDGEQLP